VGLFNKKPAADVLKKKARKEKDIEIFLRFLVCFSSSGTFPKTSGRM